MNPWTILGFDGSLESIPWRPRRIHTGVRLPKDFRPVNVYPPSTRSALVVDENSDVSLPLSAWPAANTWPSAASWSIHSTDLSPLRHTSAAVPTQY